MESSNNRTKARQEIVLVSPPVLATEKMNSHLMPNVQSSGKITQRKHDRKTLAER